MNRILAALAVFIAGCEMASAREFRLMPAPQECVFQNDQVDIPDSYSLVHGCSVEDTPTLALLDSLMPGRSSGADFSVTVGTVKDREMRKYRNRVPEKAEGYYLKIDRSGIVIAGTDERGAYYGVQTLSQFLTEGKLPAVEITDWPDVPYRGVVEGFYGIPWSHEARLDQLEFYGKVKMNIYIYGPKDDPYHRTPHWRDPYPPEDGARIRELAERARQNEVIFYWAIHPGVDIRWNEEDRSLLLEKFESMYELGVRGFAVFFDDISGDGTDPVRQVELLNHINRRFVKEKGDVAPLVVCPTIYNRAWMKDDVYTKTIGEGLDDDIRIMWTGDKVVTTINKGTLDFINPQFRRKAFIWWNYPVSDYVADHLLLGPVYGNDIDIKDEISAFVSNPMEYAEASKIAFYGVADYTWNMDGYDSLSAWEYAINALMPENARYLEVFASHNSDPGPSGHEFRREESVGISPSLDALVNSYVKGEADTSAWKDVAEECLEIVRAADALLVSDENKALVREIRPWLYQFRLAGEYGLEALALIKCGLHDETFTECYGHILSLQKLMKETDDTYNRTASSPGVKTCSRKLMPAFNALIETAVRRYDEKNGTVLARSFHSIGKTEDRDVAAMQAMVWRLIPGHAGNFIFDKADAVSGNDCFQIDNSPDGKIIIRGNNANSMAMGLNHYLRYFCLTTVSWYADIPVEMPRVLPPVDRPVTVEARVDRRFFLNYCTFGYSMPFWQWEDWERLIDWMALNGINMPLAVTGQEGVWYRVWRKTGLSDEEIRSYFTGPAYLPWHRMANIDGWNGPLPEHWTDSQIELQKKILSRERDLGMTPVLPAFAGHVPAALKRIYPDADIQHLGKWAGFPDEYRCSFLNPEDPLFAHIQRLFLEEQNSLFGTDHIYGIDPFNEVDPPHWEPEYLRKVSAGIYGTLTDVDPEAEWLQMAWLFYYDSEKWTDERIKALLAGVPPGRMTLLDYHCENVELWKKTEGFYGQPYIWCYLGNFGGNTSMTGNVRESGARLENALVKGGKNLRGIGSTLEGLDVMQFPYEYILEKAWETGISDSLWVASLADRHAGMVSESVRRAWKILFNDVYVQVPTTLGILPDFRPVMGKCRFYSTEVPYRNEVLLRAWELLLDIPDADRDALEIDIIVVGRQLLGNCFLEVKEDFDRMYQERNLDAMKADAALMKELLSDIGRLASFHPHASVADWLSDARAYGDTVPLKDYYERNARNLITTWGGSLNDYANRAWAGMVDGYYAGRWDMYIEAVMDAAVSGNEFDQEALDAGMEEYETSWVNSAVPVTVSVPDEDLLSFARSLLEKYHSRIYGTEGE